MKDRPRFGNGPAEAAARRALQGLPNSIPLIGQRQAPMDRFGRPIGPHDLIQIVGLTNYQPLFRVIQLEASMDPNKPGGVKITLVTEFEITTEGGKPTQNVLRVVTAAEQGLGGEDRPPAPVAPDGAPDAQPGEPETPPESLVQP